MLVQFGNNWVKKFLELLNWTRPSSEFFSSNYFQIGQHLVLLHIQIHAYSKLFSAYDCGMGESSRVHVFKDVRAKMFSH